MEEFKQYYNTQVRLVVDARGYDKGNWSHDSNVSLEMDCVPVSETERLLNLERICVLNTSQKGEFRKGSINKDYIIGVLEGQTQTKE